ncbi:MAG: T3SS effector HopA1 family protein [Thermoleophilia bacterium]
MTRSDADRAAIRAVLDALVVDGPATYCWLGQRYVAGGGAPGALVDAVAERLYWDFHCPGVPAPSIRSPRDREGWSGEPGEGGRSPSSGWSLVGVEDGELVVERDGLHLRARRDDVVGAPDDLAPGAAVAVLVPSATPGTPGGFRTHLGEHGDGAEPGTPVDRHYWNARAEGREALAQALVPAMDEAGIPFRFKVLNDRMVRRRDAGVLYTRGADREAVTAVLRAVLPGVARWLRDGTPPFTLARAPGVGFAEDPPGDLSFGEHRTRLLADALTRPAAWEPAGAAAREALVMRGLAAAGLEPGRMHANPGAGPAGDPTPLA